MGSTPSTARISGDLIAKGQVESVDGKLPRGNLRAEEGFWLIHPNRSLAEGEPGGQKSPGGGRDEDPDQIWRVGVLVKLTPQDSC